MWQGVRRHLTNSPLSEGLLRTELRLLSLADKPKTSPLDTSNLTVIIKTFERPGELRRLVARTRSRYRGLRTVVADDSRHPTGLPQLIGMRMA